MRFREHRGGLAESVETLTELSDRNALVNHCQSLLQPYSFHFEPSALKVEPYGGKDTRIGWDETYIVTVEGYGVMGFTDAPC